MQLIRQYAKVHTKKQLLAAIKMAEDYPGSTKIDLITKEGVKSSIIIYGSANTYQNTKSKALSHKEKIALIRRKVRKIPAKQLF